MGPLQVLCPRVSAGCPPAASMQLPALRKPCPWLRPCFQVNERDSVATGEQLQILVGVLAGQARLEAAQWSGGLPAC